MKRTLAVITACALLTLGGCNKKSDNPPPSAGNASPPTAATGSGSAAAPGPGSAAGGGSAAAPGPGSAAGSGSAAAVDVPTEMDFEGEAKAKITDKNVEAQVQALEKQLNNK
jgi:hypothetical protein